MMSRILEFSATLFIEDSAFNANSGNMKLIYCFTVAVNHVTQNSHLEQWISSEVRGLTTLLYVVYDYTSSGHMDM